jgi:glycogen debranching enzyme
MRVLSAWRLTFGGRAPSLLSGATSADNASFTAHLTNRPLPPLGGHETPEGVIHIERTRVLAGDVLYEALTLTNYGASEAEVPLSLSFAADFKDMFEVRGTQRPKRGTVAAPRVADGAVRLRYDGLDGVERNVTVHFSPAPDALSVDRADYTLTIAAQACLSIYLTVDATLGPAHDGEGPGCGRVALRTALVGVHREMRSRRESMARVNTGNPLFDAWLDRSLADLGLLTTQLDTGPYPYAGIPWFSTPFGRDAVITSLQMLWLQPSLARGVLRFLAEHQARETSAFRDAEPGKIMHEFRRSEMAATGEVPFALYYGGVDTTPLFIVLAGAYVEHTGDDALIDELWPALERAAQWVIDKCDRNPYGLLDYQRTSERGLANQGWKDSHDSVFHADGRSRTGRSRSSKCRRMRARRSTRWRRVRIGAVMRPMRRATRCARRRCASRSKRCSGCRTATSTGSRSTGTASCVACWRRTPAICSRSACPMPNAGRRWPACSARRCSRPAGASARSRPGSRASIRWPITTAPCGRTTMR